ncbi:MAG: CHAT domain-containing protein, partial [Planctomycetota bacterium]
MRDTRIKLAGLVSATPSPDKAEALLQNVKETNQQKETLEKTIALVNPATARELAVRDAKIQDLLDRLPEGVGVVDFAQHNDRQFTQNEFNDHDDSVEPDTRRVNVTEPAPVYDAFVLRSGQGEEGHEVAWIPLGPAPPIDEAIEAWRTSLTGESPSRGRIAAFPAIDSSGLSRSTPSRELRQRIWNKLEPHLEGLHTLIVIPDGKLHRLPWAALPGRNEGEFLLHDYALSTVSMGQQLFGVLEDASIKAAPSLLVAGGIQYGERASQWGDLLGTVAEADSVLQTWSNSGSVVELRGVDADEQALAKALPDARFAHLATHGFFDTKGEVYGKDLRQESLFEGTRFNRQIESSIAYRNPLLMTGIVMAGANTPSEWDEFGLPVG